MDKKLGIFVPAARKRDPRMALLKPQKPAARYDPAIQQRNLLKVKKLGLTVRQVINGLDPAQRKVFGVDVKVRSAVSGATEKGIALFYPILST